jgi:hypothetical protein
MSTRTENFNRSDPYSIDRQFADIAPAFADSSGTGSTARGAADRMWDKVEEDLEKIDQTDIDEADDD